MHLLIVATRWRNLGRPLGALKDFWGEFKMVLGAHRERHFLLQTQPHLTNWIPIMVRERSPTLLALFPGGFKFVHCLCSVLGAVE